MTKTKRLTIVAVAAAVALGLSGCVKVITNIAVHDDNTVSGEMVFAMSKEFTEGLTDEDIFSQVGGDDTSGMTNARSEPYDDGTFKGSKVIFEDEPIDTVGIDGAIVRDGDVFRFQGTDPASEDTSMLTEDAVVTMSITFPGAVTDTNGNVSGTTVTWNLLEMTEAPFAVAGATGSGDDAGVASAGGGGGIPTWVWLALGAVVVVAVVYFLSKRGKAAPVAEAAPAESTAKAVKPEAAKPAVEKKATDKK